MRVENENARQFYTEEAIKSSWSTRQLERQINFIRDPYVLEFLGLNPNDDFFENDLEEALITHLQKFLLELRRK